MEKSRQIKFRAFNKANKRMLGATKRIQDFFTIRCDGKVSSSYELILMQYTNRKDKNSVEIYEGDIVVFRDKEKFVIEYNIERTEFRAYYHKIDDRDIYTDRLISDRCEVIGNIYEIKEK